MDHAHEGAVHSLQFIPGRYEFVSGAGDNALCIWSVDEIDHSPRVLKSREGHVQSSVQIRFYGYNSMIAREDSGDGLNKPDNHAMCCDVANQGETVVVGYRRGDICV